MRKLWLGRPRSRGPVIAGLLSSILLHLLLGASLYLTGSFGPPVIVKQGEPLFVDIAPDRPKEPAPRGNPARPPEPSRAPQQQRADAPAALPRAAEPPAPKASIAERARPEPAPAEQVAKTPTPPAAPPMPSGEEPLAPPVARAPEPVPPPPQLQPTETAKAETPLPPGSPPAAPLEDPPPKLALSKPSLDLPPGMLRTPGGGLRDGRGGVEGEPIPLDTREPKYQDYFNKVRERIKAKWIYPREAGERGVGGDLLIEFHIAKDGRLQYLDLRRSSGEEILDRFAMNAVRLAQPFPPVPDDLARHVLSINGLFRYQIIGTGLLNQYLR